MDPLGADLTGMIPFRDQAACDAARAIGKDEITRREPHHHAEFRVRVIEDPDTLYQTLAEDILSRIVRSDLEGRRFVGVFPVGPVGQYARLAQELILAHQRLDHCTLFFLDEYAYPDGSTIDKRSPWSFEFTANASLVAPVVDAGLPGPKVHFPGPDNIDHYDEMILEASDGRGAEVVYGGIGWCGHIAFWEPHLREEFGSDEEWQAAHSAFVRLHPMSILHNSLRAGGDWSSIPPCAYTVGPGVILGAQYRSFWCDASLGSGMSWQRFIGRLATHGPVTPLVPASYLQTVPGEVTFLGAVAEPIGGPRTSWQ